MRLSRCLSILAFIALLTHTAFGQVTPFEIDANHSTIGFTVKIYGGFTKVDGDFTDFSGHVFYDETDLTQASFNALIQATSINTGNSNRDDHLRSDDFFDVANHPEIVFESERIDQQDNRYVAIGTLTMRGVSKTIEIPFQRMHEEPVVEIFGRPTVIFEGGLTLNRKEYGIKANTRWNRIVAATGELAMSDDVEVRLRVVAREPKPEGQ